MQSGLIGFRRQRQDCAKLNFNANILLGIIAALMFGNLLGSLQLLGRCRRVWGNTPALRLCEHLFHSGRME